MLDAARHQTTNSFQFSDGIGHTTQSYETWEATNSVLRPSELAQNYRDCGSLNDMEVKFGTESKEVDESGICSPPLWTRSPPRSPQYRKNNYRSLSPASRTQAIVRGQKELMEMVRNMPESSYELTLKDLVEQQGVDLRQGNTTEERNFSNTNVYKREGSNGSKKFDKKAQRKRGGNIDHGGFYLKMVFPTSLGFKKKKMKKSESSVNSSSKVSPKPSGCDGSAKGVDKEWWNKSVSACGESDSGASSINSGSMKSSGSSSSSSSSRSNSRHEKSGGSCWSFICRRPEAKHKNRK